VVILVNSNKLIYPSFLMYYLELTPIDGQHASVRIVNASLP
jgi:hypothetical protein